MGSLTGLKKKYSQQKSSTMIHVDEDDPVGELEPSFPQRDVVIKRGVEAEEFYDMLSEVGRGKFGTVYHCREKATGLELAAKFVSVTRREDRRNAEREVDIMRQLQHPRLIQLYDAFDTGKLMCVVLELITGGELFERVIDDDFVLTEKACTVFMRQICEGIEFVHQQNILHLDMKPENILCLTKSGNRIKIIDFGLARKYDPTKKLQILFGTPEFVAPEVVNFDQIGFGTDMWSIGVICYVLLSGLSPFQGETDIKTMANVTIAKYDFDDEAFNEISEDAKDFIRQLLIKDKQVRLSAQQCVAHKWLRKRPPPLPEKPPPVIEPPPTPVEELDVAKDNLRMFVERWSEHPNSPYLFDVSTHEITPCMSLTNCYGRERSPSQHSMGGCSPSPCGSINSLPDYIPEAEDVNMYRNDKTLEQENDESHRPAYNSYHSLERRASDSSCFINKKADITLRVNLADEIKKLSDHLYLLSTMNTDLGSNCAQQSKTEKISPEKISSEKSNTTEHEESHSSEKMTNGYCNNSTMNSNSNSCNGYSKMRTASSSSVFKMKSNNGDFLSSFKNESKTETKSTQNGISGSILNKFSNPSKIFHNQSFNEGSNRTNKIGTRLATSPSSSQITSSKFAEENESGIFSNLPWARRKFKINNASRDVPLSPTEKKRSIFGIEFNKRRNKIDNLVNPKTEEPTNGNVNNKTKHYYKKTADNGDVKENANNTKDLLLHLLDQWDESQGPPTDYHSGRHKSISMEWSEAEKVAPNSMSSINDFFRRQSSSSSVKKKQDSLSSNGFK